VTRSGIALTSVLFSIGTVSASFRAFAQTPRLAGTVSVDIVTGRLSADVCLAQLADRPSYRFALHHGLNIESVRTSAGRMLTYEGYNPIQPAGVALRYTIRDTLGPSQTICVRYTGAFPVYDSAAATVDSKENIAFGHRTARAAEDTRWYPVPYDSSGNEEQAELLYHLRVECQGCRTIYINGAPPAPGPVAELSSARPRALLLYAGEFPATERHGRLFLGAEISDTAARVLEAKVGGVLRFYQEWLALPVHDTVVFMSFRPVRAMRLGQLWAFVTAPTVALNKDFAVFVDPEAGEAMTSGVLAVLAHELAHVYLGAFSPRGSYTQFYMESIAEYLGLKAIAGMLGEAAFQSRLRSRYEELRGGPLLPTLDQIGVLVAGGANPLEQNRYRYSYGPLLLLALERDIGAAAMARVLRAFIASPPPQSLDYADLRRAVLAAGVPGATWQRFERECIRATTDAPCLATLVK
jgi:hypothetical protein